MARLVGGSPGVSSSGVSRPTPQWAGDGPAVDPAPGTDNERLDTTFVRATLYPEVAIFSPLAAPRVGAQLQNE